MLENCVFTKSFSRRCGQKYFQMSITDDGIGISMSKCIGSDVGPKNFDKKSKKGPTYS